MKAHFNTSTQAPSYDHSIAEWLESYTPPDLDGAPRRVGVLARINGEKVVYRAIDGLGIWEISDAYKFLESIGLVDLQIYDHPRFNCIYGLPEDKPIANEPFSVTCFENNLPVAQHSARN